jgi:hypothetical protein
MDVDGRSPAQLANEPRPFGFRLLWGLVQRFPNTFLHTGRRWIERCRDLSRPAVAGERKEPGDSTEPDFMRKVGANVLASTLG